MSGSGAYRAHCNMAVGPVRVNFISFEAGASQRANQPKLRFPRVVFGKIWDLAASDVVPKGVYLRNFYGSSFGDGAENRPFISVIWLG